MERVDIERRKLTLDDLAHVDEESGVGYWYARDIMGFLGYQRWENFTVAVERARVSGKASKTAVEDHFHEVTKMVELGSGSKRKVKDCKFTRYACYLIAQNGDRARRRSPTDAAEAGAIDAPLVSDARERLADAQSRCRAPAGLRVETSDA